MNPFRFTSNFRGYLQPPKAYAPSKQATFYAATNGHDQRVTIANESTSAVSKRQFDRAELSCKTKIHSNITREVFQ